MEGQDSTNACSQHADGCALQLQSVWHKQERHCQSLAIARVQKTQFAGLVAPLLPYCTNHCNNLADTFRQTATSTSYPAAHLSPLVVTTQRDCQQSHGCLAWTLVSLHVTAASTSASLSLCKVMTTVFGAFRCRQRLPSCCSPIE